MKFFSRLLVYGFALSAASNAFAQINVGLGVDDITSWPSSPATLMGWADPAQTLQGIRTRLWSKAAIFEDIENDRRVVFIVIDHHHSNSLIKLEVLRRLESRFGDLYNEDNVMITATHTHASPGGINDNFVYNIATRGIDVFLEVFDETILSFVTEGIVRSIEKAHHALETHRDSTYALQFNEGHLHGVTENRSPEAYDQNFKNPGRIDPVGSVEQKQDPVMSILKITRNGEDLGMLNWFGVHATSFSSSNHLMDGDNKLYGAWFTERLFGADYNDPNSFLAFFSNPVAGDIHPIRSDKDRSPHADYINAKELGEAQANRAVELYQSANDSILSGEGALIRYAHGWFDLRGHRFYDPEDQTEKSLCQNPATGWSIAALNEAHPTGIPGVKEGLTTAHPVPKGEGIEGKAKILGVKSMGLKHRPTDEDQECHDTKLIQVAFDQEKEAPHVVGVQIFIIGNLAILGLPAEVTTMSARILRRTLHKKLSDHGVRHIIIQGYANSYMGYVTTKAEYQVQHYEGSHTLYGPNTLAFFRGTATLLADFAIRGSEAFDATPRSREINTNYARKQRPHPLAQYPGKYGAILKAPEEEYQIPSQSFIEVKVRFETGDPRMTANTSPTHLKVQRLVNGQWQTLLTDADPETEIRWKGSEAEITWKVDSKTDAGTYRIWHTGNYWSNSNLQYRFETVSPDFRLK